MYACVNYLLQADVADESPIVQFLRRPCNRNAFLHGIGGGIASGLLYFLFTSTAPLFIQFHILLYVSNLYLQMVIAVNHIIIKIDLYAKLLLYILL